MKVTETYVRRLEISGVEGLDPIRVVLEDIGPGQGRINIECWGESWANYWGGMGNSDLAEFFSSCSVQYLAGKMSSIPQMVFDPEGLIASLNQEVIRDRRKGFISQKEARKSYERITDLDPLPSTVDGLWYMANTMQEILGDEWWYRLPEKANPDYVYLTKILKAVQEALTRTKGGAA